MMRVPGAPVDTTLRFVIPSDLAARRPVQKRIMQEVEKHAFCPDATWAIQLALEEALSNAIKHGNKLDPEKMVRVEARVDPAKAEIVVEDEGCGFDRKCVPDPRADENLEKLHGRGILLMESYMDEIQWSCGGRRVRMVRLNEDRGCCRG